LVDDLIRNQHYPLAKLLPFVMNRLFVHGWKFETIPTEKMRI
jgi:hypothetical protein